MSSQNAPISITFERLTFLSKQECEGTLRPTRAANNSSRVWSAGTRTWLHHLGGTRDKGRLWGRALPASSMLALSLGVPRATCEQLLWLALPSTQRSGCQNRASLCLPCSRWVRPISGHLLSLHDLVHSGPCSQIHVECHQEMWDSPRK